MVLASHTALRHRMAQEGHEAELRRCRAGPGGVAHHRPPAVEDRRAVHADTGVGEPCAVAVIADVAIVVQDEITARVLRGIVDQHQMRIAGRRARQRGDLHIRPHIAVDHQERCLAEDRQGIEDATTGFQRHDALIDEVQAQPPARTVAQRGCELVTQPRGVDHHLIDPGGSEPFQVPHDQRFATGDQQWLGGVQGQRAHALAFAGREDHGLHGRASTGSAMRASAGLIRSSNRSSRGASCG